MRSLREGRFTHVDQSPINSSVLLVNFAIKVVALDSLGLFGHVATPHSLVTVDGTLDFGVFRVEAGQIGTHRRAPCVILNELIEDLFSSLAHESSLHH